MDIKRFILEGELHVVSDLETTDDLLVQAGRALDKACTSDILGPVVFEGEDGKLYTIAVEAIIDEVEAATVRDCFGVDPETGEQLW